MSILQEYEEIRRSLGEEVFAAIERYLEEHPELFLSDIYYKKEEFEKFETWYGKPVHQDNSDTAILDVSSGANVPDEDTSLNFSQLRANFNASGRQRTQLKRTGRLLFSAEWKSGSQNDLLCAYLREKGYPYLRTFNGDVWYMDKQGQWCSADLVVEDNILQAYELA